MRLRLGVVALGVVVLAVLPLVLSEFRTVQLATVGAYFIAIVGLDVLIGTTGQISLGHGGFIAIGAYTTAILMADHGVRDLWTIPIAAAVAGGVGVLTAFPALRLPGHYLALTTLGLALVLPTIATKFDHFTGGSTGINLFGRATETGHGTGVLGLTNNDWLYALTWVIALVCFLLAWLLLHSRFARSLRAVRDGDLAAAASGINRLSHELAAVAVSAAFAGVAGALLALDVAFVAPGTFPLRLSLFLLAGAIVGFFASLWGALLGALLVVFLPDVVDVLPHVNGRQAGPATFFFGLLLVLAMVLLPLVRRLRRTAL